MDMNYTLGRGRVFFSRFLPGTQTPEGFRYIGNTPAFSLTITSDNLDHFSSDEGIKEKDLTIPLSVTRTGKLTTDAILPDNVAMFFFGTAEKLAQGAVAAADYTLTDVKVGFFYQLGQTAENPVGLRGLDLAGATYKKGATTLTLGTDLKVDADTGMVEILAGGTLADGDDITINVAVKASTRERVISGSTPVEGAIRYIANNPQGKNLDYYLPYVKITPDGDYTLKGDELQQIPFNIEALKPNSGGEAILCDGRPVFA